IVYRHDGPGLACQIEPDENYRFPRILRTTVCAPMPGRLKLFSAGLNQRSAPCRHRVSDGVCSGLSSRQRFGSQGVRMQTSNGSALGLSRSVPDEFRELAEREL